MDGPTDSYPLLSGAAGYAYREEPDTAIDDEPPTEEFPAVPPPGRATLDAGPNLGLGGAAAIPVARRRGRPKAVVALLGAVILLGVGAVAAAASIGSSPSGAPSAAGGPAAEGGPAGNKGPAQGGPAGNKGPAQGGPGEGGPVGEGRPAGEGGPAPEGGSADDVVPAFAAGTFDLASSVGELNLALGRPGDGPAQVSSPAGSGLVPAVAVEGSTVRLTADAADATGAGRVDVVLDARIDWTIRMSAGVRVATFELGGGTVREVDLGGGADTVRLTLPGGDRVLPVRMSGGVRDWSIATEGEVPVRVVARSGAGEVTLYGRRQQGIARDTTLTAGQGPGLDVTAAAGFGSLTVSPSASR
ncbi:hypothetical protein ACFY36_32280 [Actinoplanes sp. NPDC000266]